MITEDLKEGFERLVQPVVAQADPYERLLHRAKRQRRRQAALATAAVVSAVTVVASLLYTPTGSTDPQPASSASGPPQPPAPITSPLARRLIDSPTRGNLAGEKALINSIAKGYLAARADLLVSPSLRKVKVLFADDSPTARAVVVVFYNDTHAVIRSTAVAPGASVRELIDKTGTPDVPEDLPGYVSFERSVPTAGGSVTDFALLLGPAGCRGETSSDGRVNLDGTVSRTWRDTQNDGYIVGDGRSGGQRWRFSCDGKELSVAPMLFKDVQTRRSALLDMNGARGTADPTVSVDATRGLFDNLAANGLTVTAPRVVWGGQIPGALPGTRQPVAVVASCYAGGGCAALLQMGPNETRTAPNGQDIHVSSSALGVGRPDLLAFRIPGDQLGVLVVGPENATRAELIGPTGWLVGMATLTRGVGRIADVDNPDNVKDTGRVNGFVKIQVYDKSGRMLASMPAAPLLGAQFFGEPTVNNW